MKSAMERRLGTVFGFGLVILFLIGVIQSQMVAKLADTERNVARAGETIEDLTLTQRLLSDAQAAAQAYVMTGKENDLEPYNAATTQIPLVVQNLGKLAVEDGAPHQPIDHLASLTASALDGLQKVADARSQGHFSDASKLIAGGTGRKALDDSKHAIEGMDDVQRRLLEQRKGSAAVTAKLATLVTTAGSAVALWLIVLIGLVLRHYVAARRRNNRSQVLSVQLLESMAAGVYLSDETGMILYANPAGDAMFGYSAGELIGHNLSLINEFTTRQGGGHQFDEIHQQLTHQGAWKGELPGRKREGTAITCAVQISALERGGKLHWILVEEDVTERTLDEQPVLSMGNELSEALEGIRAC